WRPLVDGAAVKGDGDSLPCVRGRRALSPARAADPVRRLRPLAAPLARRRDSRPAARLLAPVPGRQPGPAPASHRPAEARGADLSRRPEAVRALPLSARGDTATRAGRGGDPLHGAVRRLPGAPPL